MSLPIYLDYNATTPVDKAVVAIMTKCLFEDFGNPSSSHVYGQKAKAAVDQARQQVANLIGAQTQEIYFTGCATEANNIAVLGLARAAGAGKRHLITSAIEHPAVMNPCLYLQREGWDVTVLPVDSGGLIDPKVMEASIRPDTAFVSIMHSNNEIGTIQPIAELAAILKPKKIPFHIDAAQSLGKVAVNVDTLGVDALTIAGHKFYASKGVGALYVRNGTPIRSIAYGADHERGIRPGTENVAAVAGLGEAARLAAERLPEATEQLRKLRDTLHARLLAEIPDLVLNGHLTDRLPNTLNVSFPKVSGKELLSRVSNEVAASVGSACHSHGDAVSGVLAAIGATAERARGAVRLSVGLSTTMTEVNQASQALVKGWKEIVRF